MQGMKALRTPSPLKNINVQENIKKDLTLSKLLISSACSVGRDCGTPSKYFGPASKYVEPWLIVISSTCNSGTEAREKSVSPGNIGS